MATNNFITNTASLKTTIADVRRLNAKKMLLNGQNIEDLWGLNLPEDYKKFVTRCELPEDENWSIWSDNGNLLYINFSDKIINGDGMFRGCSNLSSFHFDLSSLTNGTSMFSGCSNLTTFTRDLSSLTDGRYMFQDCSNLTSFKSDLSSLINGYDMFYYCTNLTTFTSDLSSLTNGDCMFMVCSNLSSFESDLSSLTKGDCMFYECTNLTTFTSDLSSLIEGYDMFYGCTNLTSFTSDLSSLINGYNMFYGCSNLTTFTSDLSSLIDGSDMFEDCSNLTTFTSDLTSLINGYEMFYGCSNLTTFTSDLSSLIDGSDMFSGCKLDSQSVMYIADSIKDIATEKNLYTNGIIPYVTYDNENKKYSAPKGFMENGKYVYTYDCYDYYNNRVTPYTTTIYASGVGELTIGINVINDATTIADQLQAFAEDATFDSWELLKKAFEDKGWNVTWQYCDPETSTTYDLRGNRAIPCPIFAKLEEVFIPSEEEIKQAKKNKERISKPHYEYTSQDGTKFYNIRWYHDSNVTNDEYTLFDSLEDAMASWNVFPKENIITTEE